MRMAVGLFSGWKIEKMPYQGEGTRDDLFNLVTPDGAVIATAQELRIKNMLMLYLPHFEASLDAMHDAEFSLTSEEWDDYIYNKLSRGCFASLRMICSLSAREKAEAFIKTKQKFLSKSKVDPSIINWMEENLNRPAPGDNNIPCP